MAVISTRRLMFLLLIFWAVSVSTEISFVSSQWPSLDKWVTQRYSSLRNMTDSCFAVSSVERGNTGRSVSCGLLRK